MVSAIGKGAHAHGISHLSHAGARREQRRHRTHLASLDPPGDRAWPHWARSCSALRRPPSIASARRAVQLMEGMFMMIDPRRGPALQRIANEIYRHYAMPVRTSG